MGCRLSAIATDGDAQVTLTFSTASGARSEVFDYVILALPFSVLRGLDFSQAGFDPLKQQAIQQLGYGTNSKLVLQFNDRYWNGKARGRTQRRVHPDRSSLPDDLGQQSRRTRTRRTVDRYTGGTPGAAYQPQGPYTTSRSSSVTAGYAQQFLEHSKWCGRA